MDIYEYLKLDHQKVSDLFKLFEKSKVPEIKFQTVTMIMQELFVHAEAEQRTFYKALEAHHESKDIAEHGEKEHAEIEQVMNKLLMARKPSAAWEKNVMELKKLVEHHVSEEEGKMFKKAKKVLAPEEAYNLKEKMHFLKPAMLDKWNAELALV